MNRIGSIVIGLLVLMLWVVCLINLFSGNPIVPIGHHGRPVGTWALLALLIIGTPIIIYAAWKEYKGGLYKKLKGKKRKDPYQEKPFINLPWT